MSALRRIDKKSRIKRETIFFIGLILLVFLDISVISFDPQDPAIFRASGSSVANLAGKLGAYTADLIFGFIGLSSYLFFPFLTLQYVFSRKGKEKIMRGFFLLLFAISLSPLLGVKEGDVRIAGGLIGTFLFNLLKPYISVFGIFIIFIPLAYVAFTAAIGTGPVQLPFIIYRKIKDLFDYLAEKIAYRRSRRERKETVKKVVTDSRDIAEKIELEPTVIEKKKKKIKEKPVPGTLFDTTRYKGKYVLPEINLLNAPPDKEKENKIKQLIQEQAVLLLKKLRDFSVDGKIVKISPGPVITMYEFEPAPGIKISKIASLAEDLALGMRARSVRIVGHLSGKSAVGIEVANPVRENVWLKELINSDEFRSSTSPITIALGKDTIGNPFVTELTKMPHLLIAGATGSGKSVTMHSIIMSMLFKSTPEEVKFLLIDPKMLEFNEYNDIPHLLHPVIFEPKEASYALRWVVSEMEKRYSLLKEHNVRDIKRYNRIKEKEEKREERLPLLVVFIDELADLMMIASRDVQDSIKRISQMARAAGIHLVVATQRPSVDVITGVIKANFPARIALRVTSKVDSRTILDSGGAESLLGMGDMLFLPPGHAKPIRVHGTYVSEEEVSEVCKFLKSQAEPSYIEDVVKPRESETLKDENGEEEDEKYREALEIVRREGEVSVSYLQRRLRIGFNRAATIVEKMAEKGILVKKEEGSGKQWKYAGE